MLKEKKNNFMVGRFDDKVFFEKTGVSRETMKKIRLYAALLEKWQKKMNLISQSTVPELWSRHFYDSFQLKEKLEGGEGGNLQILDIGSGAGFPGLLLSMLGLGQFHMVESNGKKCTFMRQVIRATGANAIVHHVRAQALEPFYVNYIISRACAPLDKLLSLGNNFIQEDTVCLFLKGQIAEQEIDAARENWTFDVEKFTSAAEESGVILKVSHIKGLREVL